MQFEFSTANRIIFGAGALKQAGPYAASIGRKALVVTGSDPQRAQPLLDQLSAQNLDSTVIRIVAEPTLDIIETALVTVRDRQTDLVIGIGGGSVVDAGKAIAALATNPGDIRDYLEVIGAGKPLTNTPLPYVAIPTTAGTGSEVTRNAVLKAPAEQVKVSLRSPLMLPQLAIVDPELTLSLPPHATAATGMDALTQLWEAFISRRANPFTSALCREGLKRVARSIKRAFTHPEDLNARQDMSLASLFSGLALANAGLGAVHGIAGPLGGMCDAPHGAACARLLPEVAAANLKALLERQPDSPSVARFLEAAQILTQSASASTQSGIRWLQDLCSGFEIPSLSDCGFKADQVPRLIEQSQQASSMKGNPIELTENELDAVIRSAL